MRENVYSKLKYCLLIAFNVFLLSLPAQVLAADIYVTVEDIKYIINEETETASVGHNDNNDVVKENLVIPEYIMYEGKSYPVTVIVKYAFCNCSGLTSVTIPNSVTTIDDYTFFNCSGLTSVSIPNSVTTIGDNAFCNCSGLTSVTIPNSVTEIGPEAFGDCSGLISVSIPNSVTTIGKSAFKGCTGLTSVSIGNSVTTIGEYAFRGCTGLTGTLTIPNSVTTIGEYAFGDCSGLTGTLTIPNSVTEIGPEAFIGCTGLTSVSIGNSVTTIRYDTFRGCTGLTSVSIGNSVTTIGDNAFGDCSGLTSVSIGKSVTTIGRNAFYGCSGLTSVTIPNSVTFILDRAFGDCSGLKEITIEDGSETLEFINYTVFDNAPIETLYLGRNFNFISGSPFYNITSLSNLTIGNSVTSIYVTAFHGCSGLSGTLTIPNSVTTIGEHAFRGCSGLTSVSIGNSVTTIGEHAFSGCSGLTGTLTIPNSVTTIGDNAFRDCSGLSGTLTIPNSVTEIGLEAFRDCIFNKVICEAITPPKIAKLQGAYGAFNVDQYKVPLIVPNASIPLYKKAFDWEKFKSILGINPEEITDIILDQTEATLIIGDALKLTATLSPDNVTDKTIVWTSNNEQVATVAEDGTVTAVSVGIAIITATCGNVSATCKVTVNPVTASSVTLNVEDMTLLVGQNDKLTATLSPENVTDKTIVWTSDNEQIATIAEDGTVTAVSVGIANITATCGEASATCKVTVNPVTASGVTLNVEDMTLLVGQSDKLIVTLSPENVTDKTIVWTSDNAQVATVAEDGTVTAVSVGVANITATCGEASATCKVTVNPVEVVSIELSHTDLTMLIGSKSTLTAKAYPENATDKTVVWGSEDPGIASVSSTGVVTAVKVGSTTITASNGAAIATCAVTVNPIEATSISLNVKDETIFVNSSTQLVATISPANVTDNTIIWSSSKPEVATVSGEGLITGISVGTTTVTATIGNVSAKCQINVVHRIPDMDPSATTSNRDLYTLSGQPVNMTVYAEGGEPSGWSYVWTKDGETVGEGNELNIVAKNTSGAVVADKYRVKVENEIDKVVIFSEIYDFVIHIYPTFDQSPTNDDITISTANGSSNKTREGNTVTLSVMPVSGGNPQGWEYVWSDAKGEIGEEETIETIANMSAGSAMDIEEAPYYLEMTNYSPEGNVWAQFKLETSLEVYRRPQTPLQLTRKGNGTSHTLIVMMSVADAQLEQLNYTFVYGWTDSDGTDHIIDLTPLRYCHADAGVYNDPTNKFWVYSIWTYQDGCVVSSGRRYLNGDVDEQFDASAFGGTEVGGQPSRKSRQAVYTIDGQYVGQDPKHLSPGLYIISCETNGELCTKKIVIR